jgi:hypothetical protein
MIGFQSLLKWQAEGLHHRSRGRQARLRPGNTMALVPLRPERALQLASFSASNLVKASQGQSRLVKHFFENYLFSAHPLSPIFHPFASVFRKPIEGYCRLQKPIEGPPGGEGANEN